VLPAKTKQAYDNLPESDKLALMAVSVLIQRIQSLGKADRDDLYELFQALVKTEDECEIQCIRRTMEEILAQGEITVQPLLKEVPAKLDRKAEEWALYVATKIRTLRDNAGLSQAELAAKAGLTQSHISRLENSEHTATNMTLEKIAMALGVDTRELDPCMD